MRVLTGRNVNDLYRMGLRLLESEGIPEPSRDGEVLTMPYPVTSVYTRPTERVLFDNGRDANPFFHLLESMWMLAGRADGKWLDEYVADFSARYAESDGRIHGAYGNRWRNHWDMDQLVVVVQRLQADHKDRRVVIAMWDPSYDLCEPGEVTPKDLPCNTHIYPRIVYNSGRAELDITVCCRSNDAIWGCYGANAVHFSFLQEYLAAGIGVSVGRMYQISNNFHMYRARSKSPDQFLENLYNGSMWEFHLVDDFDAFNEEVYEFCEGREGGFRNAFLQRVASPMREVCRIWRQRGAAIARLETSSIQSDDWRMAAERWLDRRVK